MHSSDLLCDLQTHISSCLLDIATQIFNGTSISKANHSFMSSKSLPQMSFSYSLSHLLNYNPVLPVSQIYSFWNHTSPIRNCQEMLLVSSLKCIQNLSSPHTFYFQYLGGNDIISYLKKKKKCNSLLICLHRSILATSTIQY